MRTELTPSLQCPYCKQPIQADAIFCGSCGKVLQATSPNVVGQKLEDLMREQLQLEKALAGWERYLQNQNDIAQEAGRTGSDYFWIIIGLILAPVIIGIIVIILAAVDLSNKNTQRNEAERCKHKARQNIELIRNRILEIKIKIATLQNSR